MEQPQQLDVMPSLFVDIAELEPSLRIDLKYYSGDNFVGENITGYEAHRCLLTRPAAMALQRVQHQLAEFGLGVVVFDGYRPQRAVNHFIAWSKSETQNLYKSTYYPDLMPEDLFAQGYLIKHSSHSRGSTVDLTLVDLNTGDMLEMGTCFDFFGMASWFDSNDVSAQARANRMLLQQVMVQNGFVPFQQEWWHFTLQDEPYSDCYFDFPIV